MSVSNEIVIITGVGGGIGRALAVGFSQNGSKVVGLGRHDTNLRETARLCPSGGMDPIIGDVASEADVDRLFDYTLERYGKVDALINNAAIYPKGLILEMSPREWFGVIETNLMGVVLCSRRALAAMIERKYGRIINLGSFAGRAPLPGASAYSVSKAAVNSLTKALAVEIDRTEYPNILVNELGPPVVKTSMSATGDDPAAVYPHARFLVDLPSGGPTGRIFFKNELYHEDHGIRARIRRRIAKIQGKKWS